MLRTLGRHAGTDYYIHLHRHVHNLQSSKVDEGIPGGVKRLHKDSLGNSRFCVDNKRRQHRARMCMLMCTSFLHLLSPLPVMNWEL